MSYMPWLIGGATAGLAARGVSEHRWFPSRQGRDQGKTVCTSAVLAAFDIDACQYNYSGHLDQRLNVLRKFGWSARSRNSKLRKNESVGAARKLIAQHKWGDPPGTRYMIRVQGHALLLDYDGNTIVDTAPRQRDRRKVLDIRAVFRNPNRGRPAKQDPRFLRDLKNANIFFMDWECDGWGPLPPAIQQIQNKTHAHLKATGKSRPYTEAEKRVVVDEFHRFAPGNF